MKTITTLNKINSNFTSHLSKFILLIFVFNATIALGQSGSCNADLGVNKGRNNRSTPPEGTFYAMVITNNGKSADTYSLSSVNTNRGSSNPDGSAVSGNVILTVEFLDKNQRPINEIKVNPGETASFFAHILVPKGTPFEKWATTQITAKSRSCSNYKVDTVLHTLVINPKEE